MALPNRPDWVFRATPRELQFLVAGIVIGAVAIIIARAVPGVEMAAVVFFGAVVAGIAFVVLAMVRADNSRSL